MTSEQLKELDRQIEERRKDVAFMQRLKKRLHDDRELFDYLASR